MMTSNPKERALCAISFETTTNYETNLLTLLSSIQTAPLHAIICAPEVCLTGFDYENKEAMLSFALHAIEEIAKVSHNKIIALTIINTREEHIYNTLFVFYNGVIVHQRDKAKLFTFGGEHHFFTQGKSEEVAIVTIEDVKIGFLICFELRFKEFWQRLEGCDVICVCAWWGELRSEHFSALTKALALLNQCYVLYSDAQNDTCTQKSGFITPQGTVSESRNTPCLMGIYNKKEIALMRRYMDVGIG